MAVPQSRIAELASFIAQETKALNELYSSSGLSPPTFAAEAAQTSGLPNDINAIHYRIVEATSELQALLLGPSGIIKNYIYEVSSFRLCLQHPLASTFKLTSTFSKPLSSRS